MIYLSEFFFCQPEYIYIFTSNSLAHKYELILKQAQI